ncbi:hypothetical protein EWM64_g10660 [Hericium alpestre]|uniref:X-box-binding protein 1 n=1 Tax=Hericium alpestre TaxID=135208 RepID=A0A4Y9ZFI2_9AGAM|nr:hypothetical protein EWM64_g10660 [Hericium alpestre]
MSISESAPPTPSSASESPEASSSTLPSTSVKSRPAPSSTEGPPRKRTRTDLTPEERKEARAHRNRIAAQNSRDKRKAQFATLERRIVELEEENRTLRASMGLTALRESEEQRAATTRASRRTGSSASGFARSKPDPDSVPRGPVFFLLDTSALTHDHIPRLRPAIAHIPSFASALPVFYVHSKSAGGLDATRHAAQMLPGIDLGIQASVFGDQMGARSPPADDIDEAAMENLFREIFAPSPTLSTSQIPSVDDAAPSAPTAAVTHHGSEAGDTGRDYEREREAEAQAEMQRLLDMLPPVGDAAMETLPMDDQSKFDADFSSALNLDLGGWDFASAALSSGPASSEPVIRGCGTAFHPFAHCPLTLYYTLSPTYI